MRYDIYFRDTRNDNGWTMRTWHIMDTYNRNADMGYTFASREEALAACTKMGRQAFVQRSRAHWGY